MLRTTAGKVKRCSVAGFIVAPTKFQVMINSVKKLVTSKSANSVAPPEQTWSGPRSTGCDEAGRRVWTDDELAVIYDLLDSTPVFTVRL